MARFVANLNFLFTDLDLPARIEACGAAGFRGVEMLLPYTWPPAQLKAWLGAAGVEMALINAPPGDWAAGERGLAALPGQAEGRLPGGDRAGAGDRLQSRASACARDGGLGRAP